MNPENFNKIRKIAIILYFEIYFSFLLFLELLFFQYVTDKNAKIYFKCSKKSPKNDNINSLINICYIPKVLT